MTLANLNKQLTDLEAEPVWLIAPERDKPGVQATLSALLVGALKLEHNDDKKIRYHLINKVMLACKDSETHFTVVEMEVLKKWVLISYPSPIVCGIVLSALET